MSKKFHMYEDGEGIHLCEGSQVVHGDVNTYLVWTLCKKDVPANLSFRSADVKPTCQKCIAKYADTRAHNK